VPSYMIRNVPSGLIPAAKSRARNEATTLDAVLVKLLESYAAAGTPGRAGAEARANSLTADERSAIARKAAETRWGK
jgi:hypothetical protein